MGKLHITLNTLTRVVEGTLIGIPTILVSVLLSRLSGEKEDGIYFPGGANA